MKKKKYSGGQRKQGNKSAPPDNHGGHGTGMAFSFGDPEPILAGQIYNNLASILLDNGQYYTPPVPPVGLARLLRANAYHGPILEFKTNQTMRGFVPCPAVTQKTMRGLVTDFLVFANAYAQVLRNAAGFVLGLRHLPAINMRKHREAGRYCQLTLEGGVIKFHPGEVLHLKNYDVGQEIYGMPSYLGARGGARYRGGKLLGKPGNAGCSQ